MAEQRKYLTAEEIADTSRYQFQEDDLELPGVGGWVKVKTLSVGERNALPKLRDPMTGEYVGTVDDLAAIFAGTVSQPELTAEQAKKFIAQFPAKAYDAVQVKFAELLGAEEEQRATVKEFRPSED